MYDKLVKLIKERDITIPFLLFDNYKKLEITNSELLLLVYFLNYGIVFNPQNIMKCLDFNLKEIMGMIGSMSDKGILCLEIKTNKVKQETINLDGLYSKLSFLVVSEGSSIDVRSDLFGIFEREFGTLSSMDCEIISSMQADFSDELILEGLKAAVFNGVKNLRYVFQYITEHSKGNVLKPAKGKSKLYDYDWLND